MTIEEIKELIRIVSESGVAELEVQRGDNRVRIRSRATNREYIVPTSMPPTQVSVPAPTPAPPAPAPGPASSSSGQANIVDESHELVKSPIVGTFYASPAPGAPPFVKVGDMVQPGTILCIIESMKLMNEIESEIAGEIVARLVENGKPVEYGEALFAIRPR